MLVQMYRELQCIYVRQHAVPYIIAPLMTTYVVCLYMHSVRNNFKKKHEGHEILDRSPESWLRRRYCLKKNSIFTSFDHFVQQSMQNYMCSFGRGHCLLRNIYVKLFLNYHIW